MQDAGIPRKAAEPRPAYAATPEGKPVNLNNLAKRVVAPALRKAKIEWRGWYAFRRGIATLAAAVDSPLAAKGLLRHSNLATTQQHYIKDVPAETLRAVAKIDVLYANSATEERQ